MSVNYIIKTSCEKWGITEADLKGKGQLNVCVRARTEVAKILRHNLKLSLASIGHILGGRDHTTIMHYIKKQD